MIKWSWIVFSQNGFGIVGTPSLYLWVESKLFCDSWISTLIFYERGGGRDGWCSYPDNILLSLKSILLKFRVRDIVPQRYFSGFVVPSLFVSVSPLKSEITVSMSFVIYVGLRVGLFVL